MTEDPLKADIVAYTAPSGARVFGGSTFGWSCFLVQNCPTSWSVNVSAEDAAAVGQAIRNIFAWADSGLVAPPGADPASAQSLRKGSLRKFVPQQKGKLRPDPGLPRLTIPDDRAHRGLR
jgi:hypothetical protein